MLFSSFRKYVIYIEGSKRLVEFKLINSTIISIFNTVKSLTWTFERVVFEPNGIVEDCKRMKSFPESSRKA